MKTYLVYIRYGNSYETHDVDADSYEPDGKGLVNFFLKSKIVFTASVYSLMSIEEQES